jgi:peptidyl-dipeptidase Dcp
LNRIGAEDFVPAFTVVLGTADRRLERIASDGSEPDFANSVEAIERALRPVRRLDGVFRVWGTTMANADFQAAEAEVVRLRAAFDDRLYQDARLFDRIRRVESIPAAAARPAEERRLMWLFHRRFRRAGAGLGPAQERLRRINVRLAELYAEFRRNLQAEDGERFIHLCDPAQLEGLPDAVRGEAREAARGRGLEGWVVENRWASLQTFITFSSDRDLRERAWRMFRSRGSESGARDNRRLVAEILALRAERARLLGFPSHAHLQLEDTVAGSPERALELLTAVLESSRRRMDLEIDDMALLASADGLDGPLQPWDHRFYAEKIRSSRYAVDQAALRPYLSLERLITAMFWIAGKLFDLRFDELSGAAVYHPDVQVWRVGRAGQPIGLFYFDPLTRPEKRAGALMDVLSPQERLEGPASPMVIAVCNIPRPPAGQPALLSWDEARTLFHEFGHALHGLASDVTYAALAGTDVPRDYVEMPSQWFEEYVWMPEVLRRFATHHATGEAISGEILHRIGAANNVDEGLTTTEYLASALVDLKVHLLEEPPGDLRRFEAETLTEFGLPEDFPLLHQLPNFRHAFAGDTYSASYYSYLWADVMAADAVEAFLETGDPFDSTTARRLWGDVLSAGNSRDPAAAFRAFRGRDPNPAALLRRRAFS